MKYSYIKSPLNYVGGKYKLLPQIIPLFPNDINTFVDLFGGGFNVGINVKANKIIYNDINSKVVEIIEYLSQTSTLYCLTMINSYIKEYNLSKTNKDGYLKLRSDYNKTPNPIMLYTLICYAFNYQIRFNSKGEFNMPFGKDKSSFNTALKDKFIDFCNKLHRGDYSFNNVQFNDIEKVISTNNIKLQDCFFYCDPPYFNSTATYNENNGWTKNNEQDLLDFLCQLNQKGIKWALSNNITINPNLVKWADECGFIIHYINADYSNCNYHKKDKKTKDIEVLITNY